MMPFETKKVNDSSKQSSNIALSIQNTATMGNHTWTTLHMKHRLVYNQYLHCLRVGS